MEIQRPCCLFSDTLKFLKNIFILFAKRLIHYNWRKLNICFFLINYTVVIKCVHVVGHIKILIFYSNSNLFDIHILMDTLFLNIFE